MNKIILTYHGYGDSDPFMEVKIESFYDQINFLLKKGYKPLVLEELLEYSGNGFFISIDDGLISAYEGINFLERYKIPYGLSLITSKIGSNGYLSYNEINNLNYCSIFCHSVSHKDMTTASAQDYSFELAESKDRLEQLFGKKISVFVYPYGKFNPNLKLALKSHGYSIGLSLLPFHLSYFDDQFALPRININGYTTFTKFKLLVGFFGKYYLLLAFFKRKLLGQSYLE